MDVSVDIRGLAAAQELVRAVGEPRAARLLRATVARIGRSLRADVVRQLRALAPSVPASEIRRRITVSGERVRIIGAGKAGRGFIRPRNLQVRATGGTVTWGPGGSGASVTNAWLAAPLKGTKGTGRGRNFAGASSGKAGGFNARNAVVFQRVGATRYPIRAVREPFTVGLLATRAGATAALSGWIAAKLSAELERLLAVELARRATQ